MFVQNRISGGHKYTQLLEDYKDESGDTRRHYVMSLGPIPLGEGKVIALALTQYPDLRQLLEQKNWRETIPAEFTKRETSKRIARKTITADECWLIHGSLLGKYQTLDSQSIDVIITDPPYGKEYLSCYDDLALASAYLLKPGASLLVMIGQSYLPEILKRLNGNLTYHWIVNYLTPGGQSAQLWARKVNTFWKPVLWFVNGTYERDWVGDVTRSAVNDNDKRFHEWGQSESGMADLVKRFSKPNDLIFDPFMGAATTGKVAITLGRRFIGIDKDESAVSAAEQRLGVKRRG